MDEIRSDIFDAKPTKSSKRPHLVVEGFSLRRLDAFAFLGAFAENRQCRFDFPALPLAGDDGENAPDVLFRLEKLPALALLDHHADQSPGHQFLQIRVGVATADFQVLHHVVRRHRLRRGHQQRVDLRHRPVDAPLRPERAPLGDELVSGLFELFSLRVHGFH